MIATNPDQVQCPYAVGDVLTTSSATPPSKRWPGTEWTQIKDCFLLAAGDSYTAGSTGGEEEHTLTAAECPSNVYVLYYWGSRNLDSLYQPGYDGSVAGFTNTGATQYTGNIAGGDQPHNNMPPYRTYYMWERMT